MARQTARLLISCPDRSGIIATVAGFIAEKSGNILDADQHTDPQTGQFFMRVEIDLDGFTLSQDTFDDAWKSVAQSRNMQWGMFWGDRIKRMAILVSREGHCLSDLLWRWKTGELQVEIPCVISNHPELRPQAEFLDIPFHHLPTTPRTQNQQEQKVLELLEELDVDLLVLARYMQVLSPEFVGTYPQRIINIHHSFLPAFAGPRPYHQAYQRGVKIIGATSHYVTDELDQGPIIAQETTPINHRDNVEDLIRKGRDLERMVLATAVRQHVQDKILVSGNKTVVFD